MVFVWSFLVGGIICVIGQLIMDVFKKTPGFTLSILVVSGAILDGFGLYEPLIDFVGAGATVAIKRFGNYLVLGVMAESEKNGIVGVVTVIFGIIILGDSKANFLVFISKLSII